MSITPPYGRKSVAPTTAAHEQEPELSRQLVRAQEDERTRISRELHDGTGQGLMVLRLYLGMLGVSSRDTESQLKVQEALGLLDRTIEDLRRIISRLSPRTLQELGLLAAIRKETREISRNTQIQAQLDLPKTLQGLDQETELAVYRAVQEALHNIAKHSQAKSFRVKLKVRGGAVNLLVEDDGIGFSMKERSLKSHAFGLWGLRERMVALGGSLRVSSGNGKGTQLRVTLPGPAPLRRRSNPALPQPVSIASARRSPLTSAGESPVVHLH